MTTDFKKPLPHPRALAHLGDAVYELWVRELALTQASDHTKELHRYTTKRVNASVQAALLSELLPMLSDEELALVKRAQNMPVSTGRRSNQATHRRATAFEALIGYWHLTGLGNIGLRKQQILTGIEKILNNFVPS